MHGDLSHRLVIAYSKNLQMGTKAETLDRLLPYLKQSQVPPFCFFTVAEWRDNPQQILSRVRERIRDKTVIVRSSALAEDTGGQTMAGAFLSLADIELNDDKAFIYAVSEVIESYGKHNRVIDPSDQVLVQVMVNDVSMSGVLFTQDMNTGAPYYVINYDDETGRTDTVAGGYCNRTMYLHRDYTSALKSPRFVALLQAIQEIENVTGSTTLDIEFSLGADLKVYIFQVRNITTQPNWNRGMTLMINDAVVSLRDAVAQRNKPLPGIFGQRSILGRMPDWNPAEMIGSVPRPLAFSLYRYLITDQSWRIARRHMGYAEPKGMPLMVSMGGQPFIDVRLSFHSYLPADLSESISEKLVNAWLDRLEQNPHLHDKVEFDIAVTILSFDFEKRVAEQFPDVLSEAELLEYRNALRRMTAKLLKGEVASIQEQLHKIEKLNVQRQKIKKVPSKSLTQVAQLLEDCIEYGTIPFAILARHGFIASSLLKALVSCGIFSGEDLAQFQQSIPTVASSLIDDLEKYAQGHLSKDALMEIYGHLRPGAYDILSVRYDKRAEVFAAPRTEDKHTAKQKPFVMTAQQKSSLEKLLADFGFELSPDELLQYMRSAIQGREYSKFVFTRNLSDALEIIGEWGESIGLSLEEMSYLDIRDVLDALVLAEGRGIENHLRQLSLQGMTQTEVASALKLPHVICSPSDVVVVPLMLDQPNFVTGKCIQGEIYQLEGSDVDLASIDGKIVVIEGADPGFDWIFTRPIIGLITKFGGANSHMAIRCAEFGLPAAIGCGEQIYDRVIHSATVSLNCAEKRILPLNGLN